ncbi:MAG: ABC transporter permease [Candidatus Lokiarchaeota archaeon]|nr:ABC transporter permease [Candidatus Lokiarchaeota archaeon]
MLLFSIKNAFRKKLIAILASVGVGFGLMLVFVIGAFTAGVSGQFQDNLNKTLGIVSVTEKLQQGSDSNLPVSLPQDIENTPGVGEFLSNYNLETQAPDYFASDYFGNLSTLGDRLILIGLNGTIDQNWGGVTTKIIQGRNFENNKNEIIIDSRLLDVAQFLVTIGSNITINLDLGGINTTTLTIVGVYDQEDSGAPSFVPREYYIYTDIQTIWNFLDQAEEPSNIYTLISLRFNVKGHDDTDTYVERINEYSDSDGYSPIYVTAFSLATFLQDIEDTFAIFDSFTAILSIIVVIAGGMAIIVTNLMSVSSRMKEFAILKATGWKNRHIFKNVIYESLTLGLLGALIGLGIGSLLIFILGSGLSPFGGAAATVTWEGIIEVLAYALGLGILGGLYPGIKASRVRPVVVLKGE